jgi:hypothetical protein
VATAISLHQIFLVAPIRVLGFGEMIAIQSLLEPWQMNAGRKFCENP